jgi:hypothetical protein
MDELELKEQIEYDKTDTPDAKSLCKLVDAKFKEFEKLKKPFELQARLNIEFIQGNQYADIRFNRNDLAQLPKIYDYQQREVYNQIAPILETRHAKLGRVSPSLLTRPATNEKEDIATSKVCSSILKGTYRYVEMHENIKEAIAWSEQCGTVFYGQQWNPKKGNAIGVLDGETIKEGDMDEEVISFFEIYPDSPRRSDVNKCRELIRAKAYHVDEIYETWGKSVKGRKVSIYNVEMSSISCGGLGYTANTQLIVPKEEDNSELVMEYYRMPCRQYPNGRLIIKAGDVLLHSGDLPYLVGDDGERGIPIVRQVCIVRPGFFWGWSIVDRLIPVQRAYNAVMNRIHEYLNRIVLGVLTYEDGSIDEESLDDGIPPGSRIAYNQGSQKPSFMESQRFPTELAQEESRLLNIFTIISGVSTFSRQSLPPVGANSGVAMEIVQEQDETRLSSTAENVRIAVIKVGKQWLRIFKQYAKGPRVAKYPGRNNYMNVVAWEASQITTTDVILESENELAQTPAQRKQFVFDLDARGAFNDPETGRKSKRGLSKFLSMLNMGENWEDFDDIDDKHIARAQRENIEFEKGVAPTIRQYDDDMLHIEEHLSYMLSADFEDLQTSNPMLAKTMEAHLVQHKASLAYKNPVPQIMPGQAPASRR